MSHGRATWGWRRRCACSEVVAVFCHPMIMKWGKLNRAGPGGRSCATCKHSRVVHPLTASTMSVERRARAADRSRGIDDDASVGVVRPIISASAAARAACSSGLLDHCSDLSASANSLTCCSACATITSCRSRSESAAVREGLSDRSPSLLNQKSLESLRVQQRMVNKLLRIRSPCVKCTTPLTIQLQLVMTISASMRQ